MVRLKTLLGAVQLRPARLDNKRCPGIQRRAPAGYVRHRPIIRTPRLGRDLTTDVAALIIAILHEWIFRKQLREVLRFFGAVSTRADGGADEFRRYALRFQ